MKDKEVRFLLRKEDEDSVLFYGGDDDEGPYFFSESRLGLPYAEDKVESIKQYLQRMYPKDIVTAVPTEKSFLEP